MLSERLGEDLEATLTHHYETFIVSFRTESSDVRADGALQTESDFAQIAAAGLNWVRIALPYWAIETYPGEPFLQGVSWRYFLKSVSAHWQMMASADACRTEP